MQDKRFFCLRGFMKSGTNWVGSLLSSHVDVSCVGEFHWEHVIRAFEQTLAVEPIYNDPDTPLKQQARQNLAHMIQQTLVDAAEPGASVIGERTPHRIDPMPLPGVPHICVIRDGRDVLVSRVFHLYNFPSFNKVFDRFPEMAKCLEQFREDPWYFQKHPEQLLREEQLVKESVTWWKDHLAADFATAAANPDLPVMFIRYEDLHADVEGQRAKMFEFLGVPPDRAANIEGVLKPGFETERPSEFLRKGAVGDWRNYFTDQTRHWFKEIAGEMLIEQGYSESLDW